LAVGDVVYENQGDASQRLPKPASLSARVERGIADLSGIALHDLPQTREEVEEIDKIIGHNSMLLVGKDATETAFKKEPLDQFRILHLAVHGFADTQYPERSALVLGKDSSDDGLLQVREIIRLKLNAQLATLSACDTGVGKLQGEEGISNLAEAFLVAGARSVVALQSGVYRMASGDVSHSGVAKTRMAGLQLSNELMNFLLESRCLPCFRQASPKPDVSLVVRVRSEVDSFQEDFLRERPNAPEGQLSQ